MACAVPGKACNLLNIIMKYSVRMHLNTCVRGECVHVYMVSGHVRIKAGLQGLVSSIYRELSLWKTGQTSQHSTEFNIPIVVVPA
jgi:hypothetical protein